MQANTITLQVDVLNNATLVAEPFERFEEFQNRSVYIGANHTPEARDTISLYRTFPKKSGNFKGVAKTAVKLSRDVQVTGVDGVSDLTAPFIIDISFSVPVGVSAADVLKYRQTAIAMLDLDSVMDALNNQQMV